MDNKQFLELSKSLKKEQRKIKINRITSNPSLLISLVLITVLTLIAVLGPLFLTNDPNAMNVKDRLLPISKEYWLGTDEFGRDLWTRIIYGTRSSLAIGLTVAVISSLLGLVIGLYASYFKFLDAVLMRICDGLIAIPGILLAIALMAALGASAFNVVVALTLVFTPNIARTVRSASIVVRGETYIEAMQVQGASNTRIIWLHIMPNVLSPLLVQSTYTFAEAIISEAALSFLGAGIPAPSASLGTTLQAGKLVIFKAWWMVVFPAIMIVISVLSLNLFGDGLRDYLDPQSKKTVRKWSIFKRFKRGEQL